MELSAPTGNSGAILEWCQTLKFTAAESVGYSADLKLHVWLKLSTINCSSDRTLSCAGTSFIFFFIFKVTENCCILSVHHLSHCYTFISHLQLLEIWNWICLHFFPPKLNIVLKQRNDLPSLSGHIPECGEGTVSCLVAHLKCEEGH